MIAFLSILATPGETFDRIKDKPRWRLATLLCTGTLFVLLWLGGCWHNLSDAFTWSYLLGPALISPLIVGIVSCGSTMFLFLMNRVVGGRTSSSPGFKTFFSLNIHCGIVFLLGEIVNFLLVHANMLGEYSTALPNRFPTGLDLFLLLGGGEQNLYLAIVLHCTSVFVLWYLGVLAMGIRVVTGSSKGRSGFIAASLWCAMVVLALGLAYGLGGGTTIRIRA